MITRGYVYTPFAVEIQITSSNGGDQFHGWAVIPMSDATVVATEQSEVKVTFPWIDMGEGHIGSTYVTCARMIFPYAEGTWTGSPAGIVCPVPLPQ